MGADIDWNLLEIEYVANGLKPREIVAKYGLDEVTLKNHIHVEGWVKKRDGFQKKLAEERQNTLNKILSERVERIRDVNQRIDTHVEQGFKLLNRIIADDTGNVKKDLSPRDLNQYSLALLRFQKAHALRFGILNKPDESLAETAKEDDSRIVVSDDLAGI